MKEWYRTIALVILIIIAVGYIIWTNQQIDSNFVDTLRT